MERKMNVNRLKEENGGQTKVSDGSEFFRQQHTVIELRR